MLDLYDGGYPRNAADQVKKELKRTISALESGGTAPAKAQKQFDTMTEAINRLAPAFEKGGSKLDAMARDIIAADVIYVLDWFGIDLDVEEALRRRKW